MEEKRHPGITMHKLSFGGGLEGLTFVVGSVLIFVFGLPALWYFVAFALCLGVLVATYLQAASDRISRRNKPLSLFAAPPVPLEQAKERGRRVRWHWMPKLSATTQHL
jgi:hypothetical protein